MMMMGIDSLYFTIDIYIYFVIDSFRVIFMFLFSQCPQCTGALIVIDLLSLLYMLTTPSITLLPSSSSFLIRYILMLSHTSLEGFPLSFAFAWPFPSLASTSRPYAGFYYRYVTSYP